MNLIFLITQHGANIGFFTLTTRDGVINFIFIYLTLNYNKTINFLHFLKLRLHCGYLTNVKTLARNFIHRH